jgi:hypothetical protein
MSLRAALLLAILSMLPAGGQAAGPPVSPASAHCDVELNVTDPDPRGLNVRASPGTTARVVSVLKPEYEWITVHVVARQGDWMRIDRAIGIDDATESGERVVFSGDGWVHVRMLGVSDLFVGGSATLRQRPDPASPIVLRLRNDDTQATQVLGCSGRHLHVRHGKQIGWIDRWCTNERTTCS